VQLDFPAWTPPAGTRVIGAELRVSYNSRNPAEFFGLGARSRVEVNGNSPNCAGGSLDLTNEDRQQRFVIPNGCINQARLATGFNVHYWARRTYACLFGFCTGTSQPSNRDRLDGVELFVTLAKENSSSTTMIPAQGCLTALPNYWTGGGNNASNPDCALLSSDEQTEDLGGAFPIPIPGNQNQGRISIKGTVYAPSSAVEFDVNEQGLPVGYPLFDRGLVARHLRISDFRTGQDIPIVDTTPRPEDPNPREATFVACIRHPDRRNIVPAARRPAGATDAQWLQQIAEESCNEAMGDFILTRARVRFEKDVNLSPRTPQVLWWRPEI
jgi:hypothetical protein